MRAVNQHGLHSPFLFDFYNACFKPSFKHPFNDIQELRNRLSKNDGVVSVTDFGAGSLVNSEKKREVSEMYRSASISKKQGELLHRVAAYFKSETIFELGTHLGLSSAYLAWNDSVNVQTLEGCPQTATLAVKNHGELNLENVEITIGEFQKTLTSKLSELSIIDLAYIDGNHSYLGTLNNYQSIASKCNENSVIIFDDINWSPEMKKAWTEVILKPEVSLSVNCYKFGMVFFREGVKKQDFYFRF